MEAHRQGLHWGFQNDIIIIIIFIVAIVIIGCSFVGIAGLVFDATALHDSQTSVLIFVNDSEDKNEECFKIRVNVTTKL